MPVVVTDFETPADGLLCKQVGELLAAAYPVHDWHIRVKDDLLIVKNGAISDKWGYCHRLSHTAGDAKVRKHRILMGVGELLERAGFARGEKEPGQIADHLDDAQKFKPIYPVSVLERMKAT